MSRLVICTLLRPGRTRTRTAQKRTMIQNLDQQSGEIMKKMLLATVWVLGWIHVFWFAPDDGSSMKDFIVAVMQNNTGLVDPMVFMVFNLLGIWPLVMVAMLVQDNQGRLKAWPFAFSSMVLGNSALYLYLFFRRDQQGYVPQKSLLVRFAESKILAAVLLLSTIGLMLYGFSQGSFAAYTRSMEGQLSGECNDHRLFSVCHRLRCRAG